MDMSKVKDIAQKLSFFKDYSSLVVPIAIGVVALIVLILTPLLMGNKLKEDIVKRSVSLAKNVKSRTQSAVPRGQWIEEQKYQLAHRNDANQIALSAKQSTQRELLSYKIFPEPKDPSVLIFDEFGLEFRKGIEGLIGRVRATDCPTQAELEKSLLGSSDSRRNRDDRDVIIRDELCKEKAESALVYVNRLDLSGYEFWEEYKYLGIPEAVGDCWYWQLAYWITEDVIDTIRTMNRQSGNVFSSPVKRLLGVSFTGRGDRSSSDRWHDSGASFGSANTETRAAGDGPRYVRSARNGLTESCTGRCCNNAIDVVHFKVAAVVSAEAVLPFMKELCTAKQHKFSGFFGKDQEQIFRHNQITILASSIEVVDREDADHELHRYGEDAVVKVGLVCEYIFNKNGYDEIKPKFVKKMLPGKK